MEDKSESLLVLHTVVVRVMSENKKKDSDNGNDNDDDDNDDAGKPSPAVYQKPMTRHPRQGDKGNNNRAHQCIRNS